MSTYNVVFIYTRAAGHLAGTITWTSYKSEEDFREKYTPSEHEIVLEKGISDEECIKHARSTDPLFRLVAAIGASISGEIPTIDKDILRFELMKISATPAQIIKDLFR